MEERFLRSLVKRYAVLMGLRPEPLLDQLSEVKPSGRSGSEESRAVSRSLVDGLAVRRLSSTLFIEDVAKWVLISMAGVLVLGYLAWVGVLRGANPEIVELEIMAVGSQGISYRLEGQASDAEQLFFNGQQLNLDDDGSFSEVVLASRASQEVSVRAYDRDGRFDERLVVLGGLDTDADTATE